MDAAEKYSPEDSSVRKSLSDLLADIDFLTNGIQTRLGIDLPNVGNPEHCEKLPNLINRAELICEKLRSITGTLEAL